MNDVVVIGAGLAGLTAAWQIAARVKKVSVVAKGWGATHWHAGCIDVLGYYPLESQEPVASPAEAVARLIGEEPHHPYALIGLDRLAAAIRAFQALCQAAGYPLHGSLEQNWLLPSAVGTFRPTCLAPETMVAGDLRQDTPMLLVGFKQLGDFYPQVAADNLAHQGIPARHAVLDLPSLGQYRFITPVIVAGLMEQTAFQAEVVEALRPHLGPAARVGFPAVLGLRRALWVKQELETALGRPVFEIPGLPPSVPGIRLHHILQQAIQANGGRVYDGMQVIGQEQAGGRVAAVYSETAARPRTHRAGQFVLATGGILGGGIATNHEGEVREVVFDLPVAAPAGRQAWFKPQFLDREGHPIYRAGLVVDKALQPLNGDRRPAYSNLFAAGTTLAHCEVIRERSLEGVALATGYCVGVVV
ncbi:MAG: glycerol-3-phosphate dehydrogenase subunit GlpB [Chloroflexi bacterium]|nr:glycerol-3-phosphate dehydrogenase subunit GlpB [Chloroflexota bacterium]MCI0575328.1 glycerol-3-phosphate dehydrogenase subunit GlpB [Chloroflexota bacterium]MCI0647319.1 glycerol-3-phosphate dehydrogenase subunit GlpB [Chloroflexota bacterium]MCI0725796.1 glycerol-3-phosphate dehydrogenase subunit GlpB [Chloroflexota bacterium]